MRIKLIGAILLTMTALLSMELNATTYNLFVHGRSMTDHCESSRGMGLQSWRTDKNNFWKGDVRNVANVRYVGFDSDSSSGAFGWGNCSAQAQLHAALNTFCTGANRCNIFTHSTGGLVMAYYLYAFGSNGLNLLDITLMANASGGSEMAGVSETFNIWFAHAEIDRDVQVSGARTFNHNDTDGHTLRLTSGEKQNLATMAFLPGKNDGTVANHSLCGINRRYKVDTRCPIGSGPIRERYGCGFLNLKSCYITLHRWDNYKTVKVVPKHNHNQGRKHYVY